MGIGIDREKRTTRISPTAYAPLHTAAFFLASTKHLTTDTLDIKESFAWNSNYTGR
jgi:hypothetical protein